MAVPPDHVRKPPRRPTPDARELAPELRRRPTIAEARLWHQLRAGKLGVKVRRQHPIGPFIADFCCVERRLVIEIDGSSHDGQGVRDSQRTAVLESAGYRVVRFSNAQVLDRMDEVLSSLRELFAAQL